MRIRAGVVVLLLTTLACARSTGPVEIPPEDLPFRVERGADVATSPAPARTFTIYFSRDGRLVRVKREIKADLPSAEASLRALVGGPSAMERKARLASELPPSVRLLDLRIDADATHVDLSAEFQEPAPPGRIAMRVAQVVWTLTEFPEIGAVRFSIDGEEIAVTTADGTAIDRPVTRADYAAFSPR